MHLPGTQDKKTPRNPQQTFFEFHWPRMDQKMILEPITGEDGISFSQPGPARSGVSFS